MTVQEKKDSKHNAENLRQEIRSLRSELTTLNTEKEKWFAKKEALNKEIAELIKKLKGARKSVEVLTVEQEKTKEHRGQKNKEVAELISHSKKLSQERKKLANKNERPASMGHLEKKIEELELKLETEALQFATEKKVMKQLKELQKKLESAVKLRSFHTDMSEISEKIDSARKNAETFHQNVRDAGSKKKGVLNEYRENSKKVNQLKKEQREAFKKFVDYKTKYIQVNARLKEKLAQANKIALKVDNLQKAKQKLKEKSTKAVLDEKAKKVEEKIKSGKKLTTEDLIVFQGKEKE